MSDVCAHCFQDKIAQRFIRKKGSLGNCDFCDAKHRKVLPAYELKGLFKEVVKLYKYYEPMTSGTGGWEGESLAECMGDWEIFSEDLETRIQNDILDAIMGFDRRNGNICASEEWEEKSKCWHATQPHELWSSF